MGKEVWTEDLVGYACFAGQSGDYWVLESDWSSYHQALMNPWNDAIEWLESQWEGWCRQCESAIVIV
jgi:hypothetical protein